MPGQERQGTVLPEVRGVLGPACLAIQRGLSCPGGRGLAGLETPTSASSPTPMLARGQ